jgi:hypothetical protein
MTGKVALLAALLCAVVPGLVDAKAPSRLFPYYEEDTGVQELAEVMAVATRAEILKADVHYQFMLSTGIPDSQLGDGRLIVVRLYCCGGSIEEETSLWAFVPPDISVERGEIVELRVGRVPGKNDPGVVNTVTAVRQKNADPGSGPCRWEPDNPSLWMRVMYCEGMDRHGWLQRGFMRKLWYKPAASAEAAPAVQVVVAPASAAPDAASQNAAIEAPAPPAPPTTEVVPSQPAAPSEPAVTDTQAPLVAAGPPAEQNVSTSAPENVASPATAPADDAGCLKVTARPGLHEAIAAAAAKAIPPTEIRFEGQPGAELCERALDLAFTSVVDRSSQRRNQDGAAIMGLAGVLLGSITPWACPTTHTLTAVVTNRAGEEINRFEAQRVQKRIGTMLACGDVEEPNDSIVTELVADVLRQMAEAKPAAVVTPPPN